MFVKLFYRNILGRLHQCKLSVQIGTANPAEARVMDEKGGYRSEQEEI